jgi:hypothetical protein
MGRGASDVRFGPVSSFYWQSSPLDHSEPHADHLVFILDWEPLRLVVGPVTLTPVLNVPESLPLSQRELPRNIDEAVAIRPA